MRCTGHCCKSFPIPYSYEELREAYEAWRSSKTEWGKDKRALPQDIFLVYPMVIPLGNSSGVHRYDCKHLEKNGDCGIYENRPRVCSEYPYGDSCIKEGCTFRSQP